MFWWRGVHGFWLGRYWTLSCYLFVLTWYWSGFRFLRTYSYWWWRIILPHCWSNTPKLIWRAHWDGRSAFFPVAVIASNKVIIQRFNGIKRYGDTHLELSLFFSLCFILLRNRHDCNVPPLVRGDRHQALPVSPWGDGGASFTYIFTGGHEASGM